MILKISCGKDFIIYRAILDLFIKQALHCTLFTYVMSELIWHQPSYKLSHYLSLVIYSLDGNKNLLGTEKCRWRSEVTEYKDKHNMRRLDMS